LHLLCGFLAAQRHFFPFLLVKKVPSVSKQVHSFLHVTGQFSAAPAFLQRSPAFLLINLQLFFRILLLKTKNLSLSWHFKLPPVVGEVSGALVGEDVTVAFVGAGVTGVIVGEDVTAAFVGAGVTGVIVGEDVMVAFVGAGVTGVIVGEDVSFTIVGAGGEAPQLSVACPVAYTKIRVVPGEPVSREQTLTVRVPEPDHHL